MPFTYSDDLVGKVEETFDDKAPSVLSVFQDAGEQIKVAVREEMADALRKSGLRIRPSMPMRKFDRKVMTVKRIIDNNGVDPLTGRRWTFEDIRNLDRQMTKEYRDGTLDKQLTEEIDYMLKDVTYSHEQPLLFPQAVVKEVREALDPELVLTPLMQRIRHTLGTHASFPAQSSMMAGNLEIPEGGEYPEGKMEFAGQVAARIGKHGIKLSMTDEAIKHSTFDLWNMYLRGAARALARHKEIQAKEKVLDQGSLYIDNDTSGATHSTGRDATGAFNGTWTIWDLFDMAADLIQEGFVPNTVIMHPFAWPIFALDPVMRNLALINGSTPMFGYQGNPSKGNAAFDLGGLMQERRLAEPANQATTYAPVPNIYPFGSLRIVLTPYIRFDHTSNVTDIYLCDARDLGLYIVEEEVVTDEWDDPEHDIRSIKLRERYTFGTANLGRAIRKAQGIVVARGYHFDGGVLSAQVTLGTSEYTNP